MAEKKSKRVGNLGFVFQTLLSKSLGHARSYFYSQLPTGCYLFVLFMLPELSGMEGEQAAMAVATFISGNEG